MIHARTECASTRASLDATREGLGSLAALFESELAQAKSALAECEAARDADQSQAAAAAAALRTAITECKKRKAALQNDAAPSFPTWLAAHAEWEAARDASQAASDALFIADQPLGILPPGGRWVFNLQRLQFFFDKRSMQEQAVLARVEEGLDRARRVMQRDGRPRDAARLHFVDVSITVTRRVAAERSSTGLWTATVHA